MIVKLTSARDGVDIYMNISKDTEIIFFEEDGSTKFFYGNGETKKIFVTESPQKVALLIDDALQKGTSNKIAVDNL